MTQQKDKLKVIIAQTKSYILEDLERALSSNPSISGFYTTDPAEALEEIRKNEANMLITGQMFYGTRDISDPIKDVIATLRYACDWARESLYLEEYLRNGNELAAVARKANPELLTLRFSSTPESKDHLCGDVSKREQGLYLFNLLTDPQLQKAIKKHKLSELPQMSGVSWYKENFHKSWS